MNGENTVYPLTHAELLELRRWNTPTIYNGWEQITTHDISKEGFNVEPLTDFMPQMGPMCGWAVTVQFEPSKKSHVEGNPDAWLEYRRYIASIPGPKVVIVQDLDKPACVGSFWGEVNSSAHKALGCVGTITDGAIRDWDEMCNAGFKALARRFCVGHSFSHPVRWGCEVEVFGRKIRPGQLIHADKHGFLAIPEGDEKRLLDAARFMDSNECRTVIPGAQGAAGCSKEEILLRLEEAGKAFSASVREHFGKKGEW